MFEVSQNKCTHKKKQVCKDDKKCVICKGNS